ncbi:MAG: phasin family protein [Ottowia sp.]|nr:phasin family protein [Ottowia sp.]
MAKTSGKGKGAASDKGAAFGMPSMDELTQLMSQFKVPGVDANALVEWQRKDLEALAEANREAYEGYKALIERRNEILQEALLGWQDNMQNMMDPEALSKQSEVAREGIQKAIENFRELAEMEAETRRRAWKVVHERLQANMEQLQNMMNPK